MGRDRTWAVRSDGLGLSEAPGEVPFGSSDQANEAVRRSGAMASTRRLGAVGPPAACCEYGTPDPDEPDPAPVARPAGNLSGSS